MLNHFMQNRRVKTLFKKHEVIYDEELIFTTVESVIEENDVVLLNPTTKQELNYSLSNTNYTFAQCALIYSYLNGQLDLFKELLNENKDASLTKNLILIKAIVVGRLKIIEILMAEDNFDFNIKQMYFESLCYYVVESKNITLFNFILKNKEKFSPQYNSSVTSIFIKELRAITREEKAKLFISLLKDNHVTINAEETVDFISEFKLTEGEKSVEKTEKIIFTLLKDNHYDEDELNAIMIVALKKGFINVMMNVHQQLLCNNMKIRTNQLLGYSCDLGYLNVCHYLSNYELDLNTPYAGYWYNQDKGEPKSMTPIIGAVIGKHKEIILFLIENNCEVNMDKIKKYSTDEEIIEFVEKLVNKRELEKTLQSKITNNKPKL